MASFVIVTDVGYILSAAAAAAALAASR